MLNNIDMIESPKNALKFFSLLFLLFIVVIIIYIFLLDMNSCTKLNSDMHINGIVKDVNVNHGVSFIQFDTTCIAFPDAINENYKEAYMCNVFEVNDVVLKNKNSDTIHIFKKEKYLFFIIGKAIRRH